MSTGNVDDVNPPRAMNNIVQGVMDYVQEKLDVDARSPEPHLSSIHFKTYDEALQAIWPELHKADPKAHLLVAVSIYIEIAERWNFTEAVPQELKGLRL